MNLRMFLAAAGQAGTPDLAVDVRPQLIDASGGNIEITIGTLSATPSGGTPPYTYRWFRDTGSSKVYIQAGSTAASQATILSSGNDEAVVGRFICAVTDAATTSADSANVGAAVGTHGTVA